MTSKLTWAVIFSLIGTIVALICLLYTSALTMTAFFFIGLPCYGLSQALYVIDILSMLKSRFRSQ